MTGAWPVLTAGWVRLAVAIIGAAVVVLVVVTAGLDSAGGCRPPKRAPRWLGWLVAAAVLAGVLILAVGPRAGAA